MASAGLSDHVGRSVASLTDMATDAAPLAEPWADLVDTLLERCTFPAPGTPVNLAVSGGADSSALLVLAVASGCDATAIHVDHGLREGSASEASVVRTLAERLGASFQSATVDVGDGPNLEARARDARYAALPADVMTGHTLDDRAETVLLHLLRGSGLDGLAAMTSEPAKRPILGLRRVETVALCDELDIETVSDPSNLEPRFVRNRIRHELLPLMNDVAARDVVPLLARTGDVAATDVAALEDLAEALDPTDAAQLKDAPEALTHRALRRWLRTAHDGYPPDRDELERVMRVVRGEVVATETAGGWRVSRRQQRLKLTPPDHSEEAAGHSKSQPRDVERDNMPTRRLHLESE